MARGLHLDLVAEGVENRTQLKYSWSKGCEEVQGFIFSPAVPAADLVVLLKDNSVYAQVVLSGSAPTPRGLQLTPVLRPGAPMRPFRV